MEPGSSLEQDAPLLEVDGAAAPAGGSAFWLETADHRRIRVAHWPAGRRGTALIFPGRTEFIEKHYEPARRLLEMSFSVAVVDWRGQGLSSRPLDDRRKGHVNEFVEFQRDVDAYMAALAARRAPQPWVLVAHSMGGAIAARTLMRQAAPRANLDYGGALPAAFSTAVMTAPMLGIYGSGGRLFGAGVARTLVALGWGQRYVPGPGRKTMGELGFADNGLTTDPNRFAAFARLLERHDDLALGAATWGWLRAAQREMRQLRPTPTPTMIALGTGDKVVSRAAIRRYVNSAPKASLVMLDGAWHEPFMETDPIQFRLWREIGRFLEAQGL